MKSFGAHSPAWALLCLQVEWDMGQDVSLRRLALTTFVLKDHQVD